MGETAGRAAAPAARCRNCRRGSFIRSLCRRASTGFGRRRSFDLDAIAGAHIRPIIPDRLVMRAAIVPEGDRMGAPAEAARPFRLVAVIDQESQPPLAFHGG